MGLATFSPADCSPSRARLGRVAAMLRDADQAEQVPGRRQHDDQLAGVRVPRLRRRAGLHIPSPRLSQEG
jgi:hypothetical protein